MSADPWKHRSSGMRCSTCMWFVAKEAAPIAPTAEDPLGQRPPTGRSDVGRCRRHAPTMSGYPVVFVADWCGDHRLDESKTQ